MSPNIANIKWQNLFSRPQSEYYRCLLYFTNHAHQVFLTKNVHNIVKEQPQIKLQLQNAPVVFAGLAVCMKCRSKKKDCSDKMLI